MTNFTYNQANRLATASAGSNQLTKYTYDAFGQRLVKVGSTTATTIYQYDGSRNLLEETDSQGNPQVDYIYLDGRPVATIQQSKIYFLHDDRLGTPQMATDSKQSVAWTTTFQPFGQVNSLPTLIAQDLRFPGQESDVETGLYHNGFRDYAPALGRYVESDPIGLAGGTNTFAYSLNNTFRFTDSLGLDCYFDLYLKFFFLYLESNIYDRLHASQGRTFDYIADHPNPIPDLYQWFGGQMIDKYFSVGPGPAAAVSPSEVYSAIQATQATLSIAPIIPTTGFPVYSDQELAAKNQLYGASWGLEKRTLGLDPPPVR